MMAFETTILIFISLIIPHACDANITTKTTIKINSIYICDPGIGDPDIFIRINTAGDPDSWNTDTIEASEDYELLTWNDEQRTYDTEITYARFKVYDEDTLSNELRGESLLTFSMDLNFSNDITKMKLSQSFVELIEYDDGDCFESLNFTLTYQNNITSVLLSWNESLATTTATTPSRTMSTTMMMTNTNSITNTTSINNDNNSGGDGNRNNNSLITTVAIIVTISFVIGIIMAICSSRMSQTRAQQEEKKLNDRVQVTNVVRS